MILLLGRTGREGGPDTSEVYEYDLLPLAALQGGYLVGAPSEKCLPCAALAKQPLLTTDHPSLVTHGDQTQGSPWP